MAVTFRRSVASDRLWAEVGSALRVGRDRIRARLMRDLGGGPEDAVIVAGSARSGTTWLGEIVREELRARLLFEPLNPDLVLRARDLQYIQYMRPEADDPRLEALMSDLLAGRIRDPRWIDRDPRVLRPRKRVFKDVRACLLLGWVRARFPEVPQLFILRHPCASVASFLSLGWTSDRDLESFLAQPGLLADHVGPRESLLRGANAPHLRAAAVWCVNNRVALAQAGGGGMTTVYYEELVADPARVIPGVFSAIGHAPGDAVYRRLATPSRTARSGSRFGGAAGGKPGWARDLPAAQIDDVLEMVEAFGLSGLYDAHGRPTGRTTLPAG